MKVYDFRFGALDMTGLPAFSATPGALPSVAPILNVGTPAATAAPATTPANMAAKMPSPTVLQIVQTNLKSPLVLVGLGTVLAAGILLLGVKLVKA